MAHKRPLQGFSHSPPFCLLIINTHQKKSPKFQSPLKTWNEAETRYCGHPFSRLVRVWTYPHPGVSLFSDMGDGVQGLERWIIGGFSEIDSKIVNVRRAAGGYIYIMPFAQCLLCTFTWLNVRLGLYHIVWCPLLSDIFHINRLDFFEGRRWLMIQYGVVCILLLLYTCLAFARGAPPSIYGKNVSVDDPWRWDKMGSIDRPACVIDASAQVHHRLVIPRPFGKGIIKDLCGARL